MELLHLETFYYVGKAKSFTLAAKKLNTSQPTISRRIALLEKELNIKLLTRRNRAGDLSLTEDGGVLFEHAERMVKSAGAIKGLISDQKDSMAGRLKILTGPSLASSWLPRHLPKFLKKYPGIQLTVEGSINPTNLYNFDILIQPKTHNPDIVQHKLIDFEIGFYASKGYLNLHGTPRIPKDLDSHKIITYDDSNIYPYDNFTSLLSLGKEPGEERSPCIRVNSSHALLNMAKEDLGIVELAIGHPEYEKSGLCRILQDVKGPISTIYLSHHKSLEENKRVKAFKDFLLSEVTS